MAAAAQAASLVSSSRPARSTSFLGKALAPASIPRAAVPRSATIVTAAAAGKLSLLEKAERCVERAEAKPLDGVEFSYDDFDKLLGTYDFNFNVGDKVSGTIFKTDSKGAYADIGAKSAAFCSIRELSMNTVDNVEDVVKPGDVREFVITRNNDDVLQLSIRKIEYDVAWAKAKECSEEGETVSGLVVNVNRGGVVVMVDGLRGFVPASHLVILKDDLLGKTLPLKYLEVDAERTRLVLSNRNASTSKQATDLKIGEVVVGTVQAVKPYGAFVDIGGVNGLLHISQISHDRISSVENVLSVGDELKVMVLTCDKEQGRVSLSTKLLEPSPGDMLRDPALVYEKADEMAKAWREKVEAAASAKESLDTATLVESD